MVETTEMTVWEDLTVKNADDVADVRKGRKKESEVRQTVVHFKADTGAHRNVITRDVFEKLGLDIEDNKTFRLAGGEPKKFDISSQIEIWWQDRKIKLDAAIAPVGANNLLSITAMELLDISAIPNSKNMLKSKHGKGNNQGLNRLFGRGGRETA